MTLRAPHWRTIAATVAIAAGVCACEQEQLADIGGPFTLTDHTGARVTEADFSGEPMLLYFGFTYCPDACPLTMQKLALALDLLGPDAEAFQPVLISLDPERDTPEQMALYVESNGFPAGLIGLTGTPEEIADVAQAYGVYYRKVEQPDSFAEYTIDHTSILYLMDARGRFVTAFTNTDDPESMAGELREFLADGAVTG